jgi:hypothetical protein
MNPSHQRTNPQRAIEEYKNNTPPPIKLGQGRDEVPEGDQLIEALFVLCCTFVGIAAFMFICYLTGGWQ